MVKSNKQLVLSVVQSGKVRQFVVQKDGKFTVGQHGDNDLKLNGKMFPKKHTLFLQKNSTYLINVRPFMDGNVSLNDSTLRIRDLLQHDILPKNGDDLLLKLTPEKHGFITVGNAKIEFEFKKLHPKPQPVPPAKPQLKPRLEPRAKPAPGARLEPRSKGRLKAKPEPRARRQQVALNSSVYSWQRALLKGLTSDLLFKTIFLVLLFLNSLLLYALKDYNVNIEAKFDIEKMPERLAQFILKAPDEFLQSETKTLTSAIDESSPEQKSDKRETKKSTAKRNGNRKGIRNNSKRRGNPVASAGLLGLIAGSGPTGTKSSTIVDALVDKGLVADLKNIVGAGTNLKVSKNGNKDSIDPLDQLIGTGGSGGIDDFLSDLEDDVPQVTLKKKAKVNLIKPSKVTGSKEALGKRNEQSIMNVVLSRQGRITYLYEKYLKRNPNLRGKISIEFTIAANGFVTSARVIESTVNNPNLERDLLNLVKRLKFDPIPSGKVTTIFPFQFSKVS